VCLILRFDVGERACDLPTKEEMRLETTVLFLAAREIELSWLPALGEGGKSSIHHDFSSHGFRHTGDKMSRIPQLCTRGWSVFARQRELPLSETGNWLIGFYEFENDTLASAMSGQT
jgi:hypothetical protein